MFRRNRLFSLIILLAVLSTAPAAFAQDAGAERMEKMSVLLNESIDHYHLKQYTQARSKLDALILLDPTNDEAYQLAELVGSTILSEMAVIVDEKRSLGIGPVEIIKRAQLRKRMEMLTPDYIEQAVRRAVGKDREGLLQTRTIGQYAVPYLLDYLEAGSPQDKRINATYILSSLGRAAVLPLCEALATNDLIQRQSIVQAIAGIQPANPRTIAPLKKICEGEAITVIKEWAARSLKKTTGQEVSDLQSAADYYYLEANRYYRGGLDVEKDIDMLNGALWQWDAETQQLTMREVPSFVLPSLMAEKMAFTGLEVAPGDERFTVLLASLYLQQKKEVDTLSSALDVTAIMRPDTAEATTTTQLWKQHMNKNMRIAATLGPQKMLRVLDKALRDGQAEVSLGAIACLEKMGSWHSLGAWSPVEASMSIEEPGLEAEGQAAPEMAFTAAHPLVTALHFPDHRIRIAAANCMVRTGYPSQAPEYQNLIPVLVEGLLEDVPPMLLLISNDVKFREHLTEVLNKQGIQVVTAPNGREGVIQALQYPPKDAIFIDGNLAEFSYLLARLQMMGLAANSPLPLTVISSKARLVLLTEAFEEGDYEVQTISNASPEDPKLFNQIANLKYQGNNKTVVILTNENFEERARLKQMLTAKAESMLNPGAGGQDLDEIMRKSGMRGIASAYVNVFLDDDLSGFDAMRTLLDLKKDPRSRPVPVAILTDENNRYQLRDRFAEMLEDGSSLRLLDAETTVENQASAIQEMSEENTLALKNISREYALNTALRSGEALQMLDVSFTSGLTPQQVEDLKEALRIRPNVDVRSRIAEVFGHFRVTKALALLARFAEGSGPIPLRVACLNAIGKIDTAAQEHNLKLEQLANDPSPEIQEAAAIALGLETVSYTPQNQAIYKLRVGVPEVQKPIDTEELTEEPIEDTEIEPEYSTAVEATPAESAGVTPAPETDEVTAQPEPEDDEEDADQDEPEEAEDKAGENEADMGW
ncbi:MAG: hypothetical protein JXA52_09355 [Planctomycetes bacterium]|nr:hypothetical protein [Planctomycetota bacterium]